MISVIVPMYNAEKTIERCIKSIQSSIDTEIEIILVNDGSTDSTLEICQKIQKDDNRIVIVNKQNSGAGLSRQAGIDMAKGEYYAFVDADDWVEPDIYIKMKEILEKNNSDICITGYTKQLVNGKIVKVPPKFPKCHYEGEEIKKDLLHNCIWFTKDEYPESPISTLWMCMYKAQIIKEHELKICSEREYYSEDSIFNLSYLSHCNKVSFLQECPYIFVRSGESMSCCYDDRYKMVDNWYGKIIEICDKETFRYIEGYLNNSYMSLSMSVVNGMLESKENPRSYYKKVYYLKKIKIHNIADIDVKRGALYFALKHSLKLYTYIAKVKTCLANR